MMHKHALVPFVALLGTVAAQSAPFPTRISVMGDAVETRTDAWIGAVMPWNDQLWAVACTQDDRLEGPWGFSTFDLNQYQGIEPRVDGEFTNRLAHWDSQQAILGPYAIRADGEVRVMHRLKELALVASCPHLEKPEQKFYTLTRDGLLFEVDAQSLGVTEVADLKEKLGLREPRFTGAFTAKGRVYVTNGAAGEGASGGCLAQWDGSSWTVLALGTFADVAGDPETHTVIASGWDRSSAFVHARHGEAWTRYRLPLAAGHRGDAATGMPMRIRQVQPGRFLMTLAGLLYELPTDHAATIRPIASHLRVMTDFVHYRGWLVVAGNQTTGSEGQPQTGLWATEIDDLWDAGRPGGHGGPWLDAEVEAGDVSDAMLMTGFDQKTLHLTSDQSEAEFTVQVDVRGDGRWHDYARVGLENGYAHHVFPAGFGAAWVRIRSENDGVVSAQFVYR